MDKDLKKKVQKLGADLRDNLNNPLQEITAMVSVVQLQKQYREELNDDALGENYLNCIQSAAESMAKIIEGLEERLILAVSNEEDRAESHLPSCQNSDSS